MQQQDLEGRFVPSCKAMLWVVTMIILGVVKIFVSLHCSVGLKKMRRNILLKLLGNKNSILSSITYIVYS